MPDAGREEPVGMAKNDEEETGGKTVQVGCRDGSEGVSESSNKNDTTPEGNAGTPGRY